MNFVFIKPHAMKIVIVDDQKVFREALAAALTKRKKDFEEIHQCGNSLELRKILTENAIDIVLLDIELGIENGIDVLKQLMTETPDLKVILLSFYNSDENVVSAVRNGARAFIAKDKGLKEVFQTLMDVHEKGSYYSEEILNVMLQNNIDSVSKESKIKPVFSDRELEIIQLICEDLTAKEIAARLSLDVKTIESYKTRIMRKTNSHSSVGIVVYALKNGLSCLP